VREVRLAFAVPYTGHEILVIVGERRVAGVAYDPLSTSPPATWLAGCELCVPGDRRVPLKVRRAVRCLATLRPTRSGGYSVNVSTGKKRTHSVAAKKHAGDWVLTVRDLRNVTIEPIKFTGRDGTVTSSEGSPRDYRAPVLLRTVRMLLTAREVPEQEVQAVMRGLPAPTPRRHSHDTELIQITGRVRVSLDGVSQTITPQGRAPGTP
jgi:hypothetical protein